MTADSSNGTMICKEWRGVRVLQIHRHDSSGVATSPAHSRRDDAGERPASTVRPDSSAVEDGSDLPRVCTPGGIAMPSPVNTFHSVASSASLRSRPQQRQVQSSTADGDGTSVVRAVVHTQGERLLRLRDVLIIVGLSRAHVYNLVKQGLFPRPIALGSNCSRWVHSEVQAWVDDCIVAARTPQAGRRVAGPSHAD